MEKTPRNSAEVALILYDKARELGVPCRIECSLIRYSDSRYLILHPRTPDERVIRISSHRSVQKDYALDLDVQQPGLLASAVVVGKGWLEKYYGPEAETFAARRKPPAAELCHERRRRVGRARGKKSHHPTQADLDRADWIRRRGAHRVRTAGPKPKWTSSESRRVRDEWAGDD